MKGKVRGFFSILLVFGIAAFYFSCYSPTGSIRSTQTPVSGDYTFGNMSQTAGSVTAVIITPKSGKSPGARTIYYQGTGGTIYSISTTPPQTAGTYAVTFNVAAASGWNGATGLSAGNLVVTSNNNQTPIAGDYTFGNLNQTAGNVTAVTITPNSGKSPGTVTIFYDGSTTLPTAAGTYAVTFDVAAASGWNAATGLSAGNLVVTPPSGNLTPAVVDYTFGNLNQMERSVTPVIITPESGRSPGARTVLYNGSATIPQTTGTYTVTFNVAAASGWNAASGLLAGTLVVTPSSSGGNQTPVAGDYTFGNLNQTANSVTPVTITPRSGKSTGKIKIFYNRIESENPPQKIGTYCVTFNVAAASGWYPAETSTGALSAGILIVGNQTPVASDYIFGNLYQMWESIPSSIPSGITSINWPGITTVTITPKPAKSPGVISSIKYGSSTAIPQTVGMHAVTFDVDAAEGWNAAAGLSAGSLIVTSPFTVIETTSTTVTISGYIGTSKNVAIPSQMIDGKYVKVIGNLAFSNKQLTYVTIPNSVTTIDYGAFANNNLTVDIIIPNTVTFIGSEAFYNNQLTNITIPAGVTSILPYTFSGNELKSVTIPNNVTTIGMHAFSHNKLKNVTIPSTVTTIEYGAFSDNELESVIIPGGVKTIEMYAFSDNKLTSVTIPNGVTTIEYGAFRNNKLDTITIPGSVTTIGMYAFNSNPLTSIEIGANVIIHNSDAFPPGFYDFYNNGGKAAKTYTFTNGKWN